MTKFLIFLFCGMLCTASCTEKLKSASGTTGTLSCALCADGTLTISGKGEMPDYILRYHPDVEPSPSFPPWFEYQDDIRGVIIGDDVSNVGSYAFSGCVNMISVSISKSVTTIGYRAFQNCSSLTNINIPNFVTNIGVLAFGSCTSLTSVIIGSSVTTIGDEAFRGCSLTEIVNYHEKPQVIIVETFKELSSNPFISVDVDNCVLLVPANSVEAYCSANV